MLRKEIILSPYFRMPKLSIDCFMT
jgi:hypothetical protein